MYVGGWVEGRWWVGGGDLKKRGGGGGLLMVFGDIYIQIGFGD